MLFNACQSVLLCLQVDAEHHGPMAKALLEGLCGNCEERYDQAQCSAKRSLQGCIVLWNGAMQALYQTGNKTLIYKESFLEQCFGRGRSRKPSAMPLTACPALQTPVRAWM